MDFTSFLFQKLSFWCFLRCAEKISNDNFYKQVCQINFMPFFEKMKLTENNAKQKNGPSGCVGTLQIAQLEDMSLE